MCIAGVCRQHDVNADSIRERINELGPWFHNMTLAGVQTAPDHFLGDYPAKHWRVFENVLPWDLRGRTVLDVGCNAGFFAIKMKERGADRVVGVDSDARYLAQAKLAAEISGVDIDFRHLTVYEVAALRERFDIVLFMGVLYHLRHPLLALDLLHEHVVRDQLLFQTMVRGSAEVSPLQPDYPFSETDVFDRPDFPKLHFIEQKYAGDATNWWVPNRACAEAMLRSAGFSVIAHAASEVFLCRRVERNYKDETPPLQVELSPARSRGPVGSALPMDVSSAPPVHEPRSGAIRRTGA